MIPAAKALGRLAISSSTFTADLVDTQVEHALEWLHGDRSRLAAVLVLRELAINAPTLIYAYVHRILDFIWVALRDPRQIIRENAADCLSQCLEIVQQRETPMRKTWYNKIWAEANKGLQLHNPEATHASLLAMRELLLHAGMVGEFIIYFVPKFLSNSSIVYDRHVQRRLHYCFGQERLEGSIDPENCRDNYTDTGKLRSKYLC